MSLINRRKSRHDLRLGGGARFTAQPYSGTSAPSNADGFADGTEYIRNNAALGYSNVVYRKGWITPGVYDIHRAPSDYFFGRRTDLALIRNPLLYSDIDGRIPSSALPAQSLHFRDGLNGSGGDLLLTQITSAGLNHANGTFGYGPIDIGDGVSGYIKLSYLVGPTPGVDGDEFSHSTNALRCEPSLEGSISEGQTDWGTVEFRHREDADNGVGNMLQIRLGGSRTDEMSHQFTHDNGFPGGMGPMASISYKHKADGTLWRSIQINSPTYVGATAVGSLSSTTLQVDSVSAGIVAVGRAITAIGFSPSSTRTVIGARFTGRIDNGTVGNAGTVLTASSVTSTIIVGQPVMNAAGTIVEGTTITAQLTGNTGGAGTYSVSGSSQNISAGVTYAYGTGTGSTFTGQGRAGTYLINTSTTLSTRAMGIGQYSDNFTNHWDGATGSVQSMYGGYEGRWQRVDSSIIGKRERFVFKIKWSSTPGQAITKIYWGLHGDALQLICDETTLTNCMPPTACGYSPTNCLYWKGPGGMYGYHVGGNNPSGDDDPPYEIEVLKRCERIAANEHSVIVNSMTAESMATTDDDIAAGFDGLRLIA